ncbi:MAG: hypothetical protein IJS82_02000 [Paludibacteraceae bacterium]|nr:hypothetical protein [Paludibacteraceae bacterium]
MFFEVYGEHALIQWVMLFAVLAGLILWNEFARRTKWGGAITFFAVPLALTIYFVAIALGVRAGADWALNNQTHLYMQGWFHYAKLYAALTGCIGFMMIKYEWGIGKQRWFKPFPFIIVAINILIAVCSDFESAIMGWNKWWLTSEGVWQYGGWHNVMNGVAGLFNIFCMTAWWNVYPSKDRKDMIWADMTWVFILVYDIWNFAYTYNCLPTHSWYCGVALLVAPTIAALCWNKGGWIQNRANTLAIWCMFAQVFPLFQETFKDGFQKYNWAVLPTLYGENGVETIKALYVAAGEEAATVGTTVDPSIVPANPNMMLFISALALITNIIAFGYIMYQAKTRHINPYKEDVFVNQKYYQDAQARAYVNS